VIPVDRSGWPPWLPRDLETHCTPDYAAKVWLRRRMSSGHTGRVCESEGYLWWVEQGEASIFCYPLNGWHDFLVFQKDSILLTQSRPAHAQYFNLSRLRSAIRKTSTPEKLWTLHDR
jgi:hypothetical protein